MANGAYRFVVTNGVIEVSFNCTEETYKRRIRETISNLQIDRTDEKSHSQLMARFDSPDSHVRFCFDDDEPIANTRHDAVFFENTDYPLLARPVSNTKINSIEISLNAHQQDDKDLKDVIRSDGGVLYGALNFKNQVGLVDFDFTYQTEEGKTEHLRFTTEVLSYKMNYRTDMTAIIQDIEREYAMLSYSFLKQTYLSFQTKQGESTPLVWWQIFLSCYNEIREAVSIIINLPKRRLRTAVKHERAERLPYISPELEQEYCEYQTEPNHLYRTEELYLSKDTVENRFLKHVIQEIHRRFGMIRQHIKLATGANDQRINTDLDQMDEELLRLRNHGFFKGIGPFKGFAQDSMVMKQARGYKDIYRCWIELQCGYELEEGMRRLEVKDISELYEIWCFIKVKNIVSDILGEQATESATGKQLTTDFIKQLSYGSQSEVKFLQKDGVELASVMYNAQVEGDDDTRHESAIDGTDSLTTVQRPDIVLRLSKIGDEIQYTYLFDAKYRIADKQKNGLDMPPVDAINQMHRYRDAIYYTQSANEELKREVIGGYVLYPGNIRPEEFADSYYKTSIDRIGIGAFPLKPSAPIVDAEGNLIINPNSSEIVLHEQIRTWLEDAEARKTLLEKSIPQKGLYYTYENPKDWLVYLAVPDKDVNEPLENYKQGVAKTFSPGRVGTKEGVDVLHIKYIAVVVNTWVNGLYPVVSVGTKQYPNANPSHRLVFNLGEFQPFKEGAMKYGIYQQALRGVTMTMAEIQKRRVASHLTEK